MLFDLSERIPVFDSDSDDYGNEWFPLFLRLTTQKLRAARVLDRVLPPAGMGLDERPGLVIDGGAGGGAMLETLIARYRQVWAIEPSNSLGDVLTGKFPDVKLIRKILLEAGIDTDSADGFLLSHIFYYIARKLWPANLKCALSWLRKGGRGVVVLQNRNSSYQRMIAELLAPDLAFDIQPLLWGAADADRSLDLQIISDDAHVESADLWEMAKVAVFMANLVPAEQLRAVRLPTWGELHGWIERNFPKGANGTYRMSCRQDFGVFTKI